MATVNPETGFWEEIGEIDLPQAIGDEVVEANTAEIARLTLLIEPRQETQKAEAKAHRKVIKPLKKTRTEMSNELREGTRTMPAAIKDAEHTISDCTGKIEEEETKARNDAAWHREYLRPLIEDRSRLSREVRERARYAPTPIALVFENNERVTYRIDGDKRIEVEGTRKPFTIEERTLLDQHKLFPTIDAVAITKPPRAKSKDADSDDGPASAATPKRTAAKKTASRKGKAKPETPDLDAAPAAPARQKGGRKAAASAAN
jgi:hypothetical protein